MRISKEAFSILRRGVSGPPGRVSLPWICRHCQRRPQSSVSLDDYDDETYYMVSDKFNWVATNQFKGDLEQKSVSLQGQKFKIDEWMNASPAILDSVPRKLHLQKDHPLGITRQLIESRFPGFKTHNDLFPVVTTEQNFDSLGFPPDHPGRSKTDTYYLNKNTVLRTHTSAHQADTFRANSSNGWLITADVYRRDAVDRSHYPIFHQMEGAMTWDRTLYPGTSLAEKIREDFKGLPSHNLDVLDLNPAVHSKKNPYQLDHHSTEEVDAMTAHLKRSLENVVVEIFSRAREAAVTAGQGSAEADQPLRVRWVHAYFPFTSPSWELEVFWQGDWLEVLGCGIVKQEIMSNAGVPSRLGWAFGLGLDRLAMLLFDIPDIRLFWSRDPRFQSQFSASKAPLISRFVPFSKYPACYKDVSFWLKGASTAGGQSVATASEFHENDFMELVRNVCGEVVEDVRLVNEFTHPKTKRRSKCYRINYRSLDRTLSNQETNALHNCIREALVLRMGVELR